MEKINEIFETAQKEIKKAQTLKKLEELWIKYLGRKGKISLIFSSLKNLPPEERKKIGKEANLIKSKLESLFEEKKKEIQKRLKEREKGKKIDVSLPGERIKPGHLHPLTQVLDEIEKIFERMGFSVVFGPEIENEWYNFDGLNIPKDHPARDLWNTFWIKKKKGSKKYLLRTHTSPVQLRYMERHTPPFRIIAPGRVFRFEATDASHEIQFYQLEGLVIDKKISVANFRGIIEEFFKSFFKKRIEIRLRPSYFPFTEPSFEVDLKFPGKGWLEIMGAGMVHPKVLLAGKLSPKNWQGFAFGLGVDRLAMIKYKVNDIRLFYSNNLEFLKNF